MTSPARPIRLALVLGLFLIAAPGRAAVPEKAVQKAVERGAAGLKTLQQPNGQFGTHASGSTALAALALLECGVAPDDECIRKAVAAVRTDCPELNRVYHLSLAIMLLDRLGEPQDVPLIHAMAVRLLEGQFPEGGWGYTTPKVDATEVQRLKTHLLRQAELKTQPGGPGAAPPLDPDLQERLRRLGPRTADDQTRLVRRDGVIDNSNTQFAVLALWVARRHSIPADDALQRAERYFRSTHENATWYYICYLDSESVNPPAFAVNRSAPSGRAAMTCAGLLGIAIGAGVVRDTQLRTTPNGGGKPPAARDPLRDPLVQLALAYVGEQVAQTAVNGLANGPNDYYFLWSVERVGVAYSLATMGTRDWYQIGATLILRHQNAETGLWVGRYAPEIDTSFALLFLRRSNFARDLTAALHSKNPNASATLKAGEGKDKPPAPTSEAVEAERLVRELTTAVPQRQTQILEQLRDRKGAEYTDALVKVIPQLAGELQRQARDALAERLARMTADTIRARLRDENAELRRAAALACAVKDDKGFIPDLVATLDDKDTWVIRAAAVALRSLTGQDFGPSANATIDERRKAVTAWKDWWKRQSGR